jgi:hypothetical protein
MELAHKFCSCDVYFILIFESPLLITCYESKELDVFVKFSETEVMFSLFVKIIKTKVFKV